MMKYYILILFFILLACDARTPRRTKEEHQKPSQTVDAATKKETKPSIDASNTSKKEKKTSKKQRPIDTDIFLSNYLIATKKYFPFKPTCSDDLTDLFLIGGKTTETIGLELFGKPISNQEEIDIGQELHKAIQLEFSLIDSDERLNKIKNIAKKLLPYRTRKEIPYTFHLIDNNMVNAFAIAGGHIYFTTGLLDFVDSDDELAMVIGHEINHVDRKHTIRKMQVMMMISEYLKGWEDIAANIYLVFSTPFGQADEYEADRLGAKFVHQAGMNPKKGLDFFEKLAKDENPNQLEKLLRSHPYSEQRVKCLTDYINTLK